VNKHPLKSRKFWVGILTSVGMLIQYGTGVDVTDALVNMAPLLIWLVTEGVVDGVASFKKKEKE